MLDFAKTGVVVGVAKNDGSGAWFGKGGCRNDGSGARFCKTEHPGARFGKNGGIAVVVGPVLQTWVLNFMNSGVEGETRFCKTAEHPDAQFRKT